MKRLIIILLFWVTIVNLTSAQEIKNSLVPRQVRYTIHSKYPTVKDFKWEKQNGYYLVKFTDNKGRSQTLKLDNNGNIVNYKISPEVIKIAGINKQDIVNIITMKDNKQDQIYLIETSSHVYIVNPEKKISEKYCKIKKGN